MTRDEFLKQAGKYFPIINFTMRTIKKVKKDEN